MVRVAVVDEDGGVVSRAFTDQVLEPIAAEGFLEISDAGGRTEALGLVADGGLDAVYVIPAGFSADVLRGQAAEIGVTGNVDAQIATQVAAAIAAEFTGTLTGAQVAAQASGADVGLLALQAAQVARPVVLSEAVAASKVLDATTFFSAGMAIFFLFFTVQFGVASLLDERIEGTMPRLLAAPIPRVSVIGGKAAASLAVGAVAMVVLAAATAIFVGADWGHPAGVAALIAASVLAALGIMAVIATLAKTPEQSSNWQTIVAVVLGMLGGTFFPVSQGPEVLADISLLTPHAWFMRGLGELHAGGGPASVAVPVLAILAFAAVTTAVAGLRVNRMVRL